MSKHRMFSDAVTDQATFLMLPPTARLLYFDLGLKADDDGIVEAFRVIRATGSSEEDLRQLVESGYVRVLNDRMLTWIVDWLENNHIRKDRYRPSRYRHLIPREASATEGQPDGAPVADDPSTGCRPNDDHASDDPSAGCQPYDDPMVDALATQDKISQAKPSEARQSQEKGSEDISMDPPAPGDVAAYALEMGFDGFNAESFVDYYTSNGWYVGRNPMKDWRAVVRMWHNRSQPQAQSKVYRDFDPLRDW